MRVLAGRYRLQAPIGAGGMATVWRAYDSVLRRPVAVKLLSPESAKDPRYGRAVRREALAAARLCHPHIAAVHDYGEIVHDGVPMPYIVMELIDGDTLAARLADPGLQWTDAAAICADVAAAMAAAHAGGLVHRDIKPGNIMLSETGVKVVDFGVAAPCGADPAVDGQIWGTPTYLAPEQLDNGQAVPAGDVYALGVMLYEIFAGRPPWPGATGPEVLEQRRRTPTPPWPGPPGIRTCWSPSW